MLKVCLITPNLLPVPNVKGGAIEGLVTNMLKQQEKFQKMDMTVVSIYDEKAMNESKKYKHTNFIYIKKNFKYIVYGCMYNFLNKVFKKNYNTYNHLVLSKIKDSDFDYIVVEGGHYESYHEFLKFYSKEQLILHLHHEGKSNDIIDKTFSRLIGVSKFVADEFKKSTKKVKTTYLNNGIDLDNFDKKVTKKEIHTIRQKHDILISDFVVLYCGRLVPEKGVLELIQAVKKIDNNNIKLMILGSSAFMNGKQDDYTRKLKEEIFGYEDRIVFTGYINNNDVYKYYASCDMVCVPSLWEDAAPLVCIESMISKKVVLATKSGGVPEYLDSDFSVIINKEKNVVNNLKAEILNFYNKKDELEDMGKLAYAHAKKFNSVNYYNDFVNILEEFKKEDE